MHCATVAAGIRGGKANSSASVASAHTVSTNDGRLRKDEKVFKSRFTQSWILSSLIAPGLAVVRTISIQPATSIVSTGSTFTVAIMGSGFTLPLDTGGLKVSKPGC